MTAARTQTRREGKKGSKNGLLKMGSPMSKWGLTPHIPSDIEESGHGKDGPNAYRLQPYPYGLFREKRPFCHRYLHFLRFFLADMPPVEFLTTFCVKKKLTMAVDTVHGSHHPCTMRGHLCEETGARCGAQVSSRGRVEKATRGHATKLAQQ
jgi:hypothetical protein